MDRYRALEAEFTSSGVLQRNLALSTPQAQAWMHPLEPPPPPGGQYGAPGAAAAGCPSTSAGAASGASGGSSQQVQEQLLRLRVEREALSAQATALQGQLRAAQVRDGGLEGAPSFICRRPCGMRLRYVGIQG